MSPGGRVRGRASTGADANTLCQLKARTTTYTQLARLKDPRTQAQIPVCKSVFVNGGGDHELWTFARNPPPVQSCNCLLLAAGRTEYGQYLCLWAGFKRKEETGRLGRGTCNRSGIYS